MNRAFEAALAARFLWSDALCLERLGVLQSEVMEVKQLALNAVADLAASETYGSQFYGQVVPPLLRDVPKLADHYRQSYDACVQAERELIEELEFQKERDQYLQDIAATYAQIEHDLNSGWKEDLLDDGLL